MQRDSINRTRVLKFALAGFVFGAVAGFAAVFMVVMLLARGNFGEMQGVAALDLALIAGSPLGALLFGGLGAWRGMKIRERKQ